MLAMGTHEGKVYLWTLPPDSPTSDRSEAETEERSVRAKSLSSSSTLDVPVLLKNQ